MSLQLPLVVVTPLDVTTCNPVPVTWAGGTPPYISTISCFGANVLDPGSSIDIGFTWVPATVYAGCTTNVEIVDSVGDVAHSGNFTIAKGAGAACSDDVSIHVTPPVSGSASSTSATTSKSTSSSPSPSSSSSPPSRAATRGATQDQDKPSRSSLSTSSTSSSGTSGTFRTSGSTMKKTTSSTTSATGQSTPPPKKNNPGVTAAAVAVPVVVLSPTVVIVFCFLRRRRRRRRQSVLGSVDPFVSPAAALPSSESVRPTPTETQTREPAESQPVAVSASARQLSTAKRAANEVRLEWRPADGEIRSKPLAVLPDAAASPASAPISSSAPPATTTADTSTSSSSSRRSLPPIPPESRPQRRASRARVQEQDGGVRLAGGPTSFVDPLEDEDDDTRTQYSTLPPPYSADFA